MEIDEQYKNELVMEYSAYLGTLDQDDDQPTFEEWINDLGGSKEW